MARGNFMQTSFLGGEWSPFSQGKADEREYYTALTLALNFLPTDEGALVRRSGTRFSAHAKAHDGEIRLIPFISESSDALVVEMTDSIARFHSRGTLLSEDAVDVTSITAATPGVVTTVDAHGWSNDDTVVFVSPDTPFPLPIRNKQYVIADKTSTTFEITDTLPVADGTDADGTELNGILSEVAIQVARVIERTIPYSGSELPSVKYTEEEDTLYLFHPSHEIRTIERTDLPVAQLDLEDGPYLEQNETATTLSFSATTGSIVVTASSIVGINGGTGFQSTDVGRLIRVQTGTADEPSWSWLKITAYNSATGVDADIMGEDLEATSAVTTWRMGLYSDTTGWPTHGVVHEGRMFLLSNVQAGRVDASRTPNEFGSRFNEFTPTAQDGTVADDNAISAIFAGAGRQNGLWLQSIGNGLLVGTDGGEYILRASSFDDPLSPFSVQVRRHTAYGTADILPVRAGRTSLFVQELGRSLYEYRDIGGGQYDGNDVARQARHLTTDGITDIAYQKIPNPVVWCLRGDQRLIGCTFRDDLEGRQVAWHRHSVQYGNDETLGEDADGRYLRGGRSNSTGDVYAIASAPFSDPGGTRNDNLWMAVLREDTVCVEYLTPIFDISFAQNEGFFVDSGNIYYAGDKNVNWEETGVSGDNTTVRFYGLDRLNGKTIDGMFRGFDIGTATVTSGYADFAFDTDLLSAAAAIENVPYSFITDAGLTFNSTFIADIHSTAPSAIADPCPQSTIITGEDGIDYYLAGGNDVGVGAAGDHVRIRKVSDGTLIFDKDTTEMDTEADAAGILSGDVGSSLSSCVGFTVPDTPYFIVIMGGAGGVDSSKKVLYYRITSGGTATLDGGYACSEDGLNVQFSPPGGGGSSIQSHGLILSSPTAGVNDKIAYRYPIGVTWYGESRSTQVVLPSINYVLANTPILESTTDPWFDKRELALSASSIFGTNILNLGDSPAKVHAGFYLPRKSGRGSYCSFMFFLADLEAHAAGTETNTNTHLDTYASTYVTGLISSVRTRARKLPLVDDYAHFQSVAGVTVAQHTDFDTFPFPDEKEDYDGNAGSADDNYYCQPTVLPYDPEDESKPWLLFFPRVYREAGDTDKIGLRIYQWDPINEKAYYLTFAKGQVYELGTDVDANATPSDVSVHWDRTNNKLVLLISTFQSGEKDLIITEFGGFTPVLGQVTNLVDERHVDAVLGCNYRSRAQLLRPDAGAGAQNGPGLGKLRRVDQYALLTFKTGVTWIGTDFDTMFTVSFENPGGQDAYGRDPLFSQVAHGSLNSTYDFDNLMAWEVRRPYPGAYISAAGFSNTSDR